jgi:hypothetical protein
MNFRKLKTIQSIMCLLTAVLLLYGLGRRPYGFYEFLHLATFITGGYVAWLAFRASQQIWAVAFAVIAILFNPIFPIHLTRVMWRPIDIVCAIVFAVGAFVSASFHDTPTHSREG